MCDLFPDTYQTMTTIPANLDFSKLQDVQGLFKDCKALQKVDGLDLSSAVCARSLFEGCENLVSVSGLTVPNVTCWDFAFYGCHALTTVEEIDTSNATSMFFMFGDCTSLPATFPWTLDMTAATNDKNMTSCNGSVFSFSSVKAVTIKDNFTIQIPCTCIAGYTCKPYFLHYVTDAKFNEYVQQHGMPAGNTLTLTITVPSCMNANGGIPYSSKTTGTTDYKVTIPDVSDWANGGALRELRANYLLAFSFHLKQVGSKDGVYTYTDPVMSDDGTTVVTPMQIKDYATAPSNYEDITIYTPTVDTTNKTVTFTASTEHLLKQSISITIA